MPFWKFWSGHLMATDDFFGARADSMINMRQPLVVLDTRNYNQIG
jgi:hypothetical protein